MPGTSRGIDRGAVDPLVESRPRASRRPGPGRTCRPRRRRASTRPAAIRSAIRLRDRPSIRATAASTRSPSRPSGTRTTFESAIVGLQPGLRLGFDPAVASAGDRDVLDHGQDHDHHRGRRDAHVGHVEDREVRAAGRSRPRGRGAPRGRNSRSTRLPVTPAHSRPRATAQPRWPSRGTSRRSRSSSTPMASDREDAREALTLAECRTRVADQPQRQQAAEQPDRRWFELTHRR